MRRSMRCTDRASRRSRPTASPTPGRPARSQQLACRGKADVSIWKRELFESNRFSLKELTAFTVELASLTNSGLPLDAAFRIIAGPGAAPKTVASRQWSSQGCTGRRAALGGMAQRPEIFPPDYRAISERRRSRWRHRQVLKQIAELLARRLEIAARLPPRWSIRSSWS